MNIEKIDIREKTTTVDDLFHYLDDFSKNYEGYTLAVQIVNLDYEVLNTLEKSYFANIKTKEKNYSVDMVFIDLAEVKKESYLSLIDVKKYVLDLKRNVGDQTILFTEKFDPNAKVHFKLFFPIFYTTRVVEEENMLFVQDDNENLGKTIAVFSLFLASEENIEKWSEFFYED